MSRTLRKAVEVVKHRKDTELNLPDEGIANLEDVPELCELCQGGSLYHLPGVIQEMVKTDLAANQRLAVWPNLYQNYDP